jgi:hypothetical protein
MTDLHTDSSQTHVEKNRSGRLIAGGIVFLLLLASIGLVYYWVDWRNARADRGDQLAAEYLKTYQTFKEHLEANRLDEAYQLTTPSYQAVVNRDAFVKEMRRYLDFKQKGDAQGVSGHSSGPAGGDVQGPNRMVNTHTLEDRDGNRLSITVTVIQEDSFFSRRPPPPRIEMVSLTNPRKTP